MLFKLCELNNEWIWNVYYFNIKNQKITESIFMLNISFKKKHYDKQLEKNIFFVVRGQQKWHNKNLFCLGSRQNMGHMYFLQFSLQLDHLHREDVVSRRRWAETTQLNYAPKAWSLPLGSRKDKVATHTVYTNPLTYTLHVALFLLCSLCCLNNRSTWSLTEFSDLLSALAIPLPLLHSLKTQAACTKRISYSQTYFSPPLLIQA